MSITPPAEVTGAPRTPLPYGLFSVLPLREGSGDRWEGGVQFEELGCPPAGHLIGEVACDTEDIPGLPKTFDGGTEWGTAQPFTVIGTYKCSPLGNTLQRAADVAEQRLLATEERQVEARLWSGMVDEGGDPVDLTPAAFSAATPVGTGSDLRTIIPRLEQAISDGYGSLGVIHMSRENAAIGIARKVIESKGGRLLTMTGTPVVAGSGYGSEFIVATPALFGYRSEIERSSNRAGDLLDRRTNDLYGVAERTYLVGYDECGPWVVGYTPSA